MINAQVPENQQTQNTQNEINLLARTSTQISKMLNEPLAQCERLATSVQGFTEYNFLGFHCLNPLQLNNLLGPTFWRSFDPAVKIAIEEIKTNQDIDKPKLHAVLLEKYLGIKNITQSLESTLKPNAYSSLANDTQEDFQLQSYFLQPFRLFGIAAPNRKFQGQDPITRNREWLWHPDEKHCDSAPLFRKIIQIYILSSIIQDYEDSSGDPLLKDPILNANLTALKQKHQQMLEELTQEAILLFQGVKNKINFFNNPQGLLSDTDIAKIEHLLPGLMEVASLYPGGRLLFGQPNVELHHTIALQNSSFPQKGEFAYFPYTLNWLLVHLNISTSFFWMKTTIKLWLKKWQIFKEYVTNPHANFDKLLGQSLLFVPNALLLASTPLLVLLPWIYGLAAIPFTLLRTFCMHGPFGLLRNFYLLKTIDIIELVKDSYLFFILALPVLNVILAGIVTLLPSVLLTAGCWTSFVIVLGLYGIAAGDQGHQDISDVTAGLYALASTNFSMLFGATVFTGIVVYLGLGIIGQQIYPYLPQFLFAGLNALLAPFAHIISRVENLVHSLVEEPLINLQAIPKGQEEAALNMPKIKMNVQVSEEVKKEIATVRIQLGKLNQSFNLSPQRKTLIKAHLALLDEKNATSLEDLTKSIEKAQALLKNNFDPSEIQIMDQLVKHLKTHQVTIDAVENAALIKMRNDPNGVYQPSWKMLQTLRNTSIIMNNSQWKAPEGIHIPEQMQEKCKRIEALKPG